MMLEFDYEFCRDPLLIRSMLESLEELKENQFLLAQYNLQRTLDLHEELKQSFSDYEVNCYLKFISNEMKEGKVKENGE